MVETHGADLLAAFRAIGAALEARREDPRCRAILERAVGGRGSQTFGVGVYTNDPHLIVDHYDVRLLGPRVEIVDHGHCERPTDWRVSIADLRRIAARFEACLDAPDGVDLGWLEERLGLAPARARRPVRAGSVGRTRGKEAPR
jgi:hypothetical protein